MTKLQNATALRLAWNKRRLEEPTFLEDLLKGLDYTAIASRHGDKNPVTVARYLKALAEGMCRGVTRISDVAKLEGSPSKHSFSMLRAEYPLEEAISSLKVEIYGLLDIESIPAQFQNEFKESLEPTDVDTGEYGFDAFLRFLKRNETIEDLLKCMNEKGRGKHIEFVLQMIIAVYVLHHKRYYGIRSYKNDACLKGLRKRYGEVSVKTLYKDKNRFDPDMLMQLYYEKVRKIYAKSSSKMVWIAIDSTQMPIYGKCFTDENGDYPRLDKMHSAGTQLEYSPAYNFSVAFDMVRKIPIAFDLTGGNPGDPFVMMRLLAKVKGLIGQREIDFLCIDRGFQNYDCFDKINNDGTSFITLADNNNRAKLLKREATTWKLENGESVELDSFYPNGKTVKIRQIALRRDIEYKGSRKESYVLYQTNSEENADAVINRYRKRVNIENFFDELKNQGWNLGRFPGWKWDRVLNHVLMILLLFLELKKFRSLLPDLENAELKTVVDDFMKKRVDLSCLDGLGRLKAQ